MHLPKNLRDLRASGYRPRSIKDELRENLIRLLRDAGRSDADARATGAAAIFPGLVGYETTVIPQLINAILARHDILLLGLRGQAKTRILRTLPTLLDEFMPVVAGSDIWDDPLAPRMSRTRRLLEVHGDDTEIRWIHRDQRYHEKLATPDVTIADLIGEVDIVKHAEGRYLSDEETMHFGLIPRSNRGIFAINELPDLAPRIQVGLFNVLEERDIQIRGYPIRLDLDVLLVFSANPEDYTNRGRIVTPLKDRIGTVIRTHYPFSNAEAMRITRANADLQREAGPPVDVPPHVHEIIEEFVRLARQSPHVNQQSGVSVRTSIAALEVVVANAERRALRFSEPAIVPRVGDLAALQSACRGKIELLLAESEDAEDKLIEALRGEALKNIAEQYIELDSLEPLTASFAGGKTAIEVGDDVGATEVVSNAKTIKGLIPAAETLLKQFANSPAGRRVEGDKAGGGSSAGATASTVARDQHLAAAIELILELLHVSDKLSKYTMRERTIYKK
ncbi:MAG: sigma 54-interacting transcriptional regulator [Phycisphaerae bacterium]|nr:sigma 54-interacting transcriptional regulator [Phycisphaerae bacterium]